MTKIDSILGKVIHDSRGEETIQVHVKTDSNFSGAAALPAGASKSSFEVKTVEPKTSVEFIEKEIQPALKGKDVTDQAAIDKLLIDLDGTEDKSRLGGNTILGVSMAVSRAAANAKKLPLYKYIGELDHRRGYAVPVPMMNLINGGKHADNNLDIQEFMVIPDKVDGYHNQLSAGKLIFSSLGQILHGPSSIYLPIGDEGGYAPMLDTNEMAMDALARAIKDAGYKAWDEVSLGLDVAASSVSKTFEISPKRYLGMMKDFPILSFEDPFTEEDWESWSKFNKEVEESNQTHKKILIVGDDLLSTNPERVQKAIDEKSCNAILVKLNQIGTVTETLEVCDMARKAGWVIIVSHRSGETLDDYIADFSVGVGAQFIKTGAPNDSHPERMTKYHRLLTIEKELAGHGGK